jgi:Tfp pilus assembly protein PilF
MMARKMFREAVDFYKPGAEKSAILANKTGIAYHQLQDLDNAEKYYRRAIKLNSKYPEAINNLGTVYYAKKSYRRAVNQYRNALRLTPNSASVLSNLGTAYFARKQYDEAMKTYAQAVALDPEIFDQHSSQGVLVQERTIEERAGYFYILAKTCAKAGMTDRSLQYIRKALENGFKERDKFRAEPEFSALQDNLEFQEILAAEYKVL